MTITPARLLLCVLGGIVGATLGALTGAYMGIMEWKGIVPAILLGVIGAIILIVLIEDADARSLYKIAIGAILGFAFGAAWGWMKDNTFTTTISNAANWALYGVIASQITRETINKVKRWTMWGAIVGAALGLILAIGNVGVGFGTTFTLKPYNSLADTVGVILSTTFFVAFWVTVYGATHVSNVKAKQNTAEDSIVHARRRIRKVVR